MRKTVFAPALVAGAALLLAALGANLLASHVDTHWPQHDRSRPLPPVVTPGEPGTQDHPGKPPSDAIILFDGHDLSKWQSLKGGAAPWKVENGYFEVAPHTGNIETKGAFGDCQLHVEWATPSPPHGHDQDRGNSGVFLHALYEVQVLDSFNNVTYADGQAGAIYGQFPPLVNVSRPPGQWQTYDIIFHGPRFDAGGKLLRPAILTVFQNGVLVQDHAELTGPTENKVRPPYHPTPDKLPLMLQDHGHPVRYRNIWLREIPANDP